MLNYISLPSLSQDAMLMTCKQPLGLIHDDETREYFESSKRGGIVQAGCQRHAVANNKYMKNYDKNTDSSYIIYMDMNNLYGGAMSQPMPYELLEPIDLTLDEILNQSNDAEIGYFVEYDVEVPNELHDKFKDYPLCPTSSNIEFTSLSQYQKQILKDNNRKHNSKSKKLILDLHNKTNYRSHYVYLKKIVEVGYKVTKIHKVIPFKQSTWLQQYIDKNTILRKGAKNKFEQDVYKLMSNAIYGKMCENLLGRTNLSIVKGRTAAVNKMSQDNFKSSEYLDDMYFIQSTPNKVVYNKPSYIANAILDISKVFMIDFHYNYMCKKYMNNLRLMYTDTDSFVYHVKTDDLYHDMHIDKHLYDLTAVKIDEYRNAENDKKLGKMKDETHMVPIKEFLACGPKSYSFVLDTDKEKRVCKGVQKSVLEKDITHDDYKNVISTNKNIVKKQTTLRSLNHQVYTMQYDKICLSAFDDKVFRISANEGYPYGYNPAKK